MISKILKIKHIRNLLDFSSDIFLNKKWTRSYKKTVIYAPNWVWKTNLSRLFNIINQDKGKKVLLKDIQSLEIKGSLYQKPEYEIELSDWTILTEDKIEEQLVDNILVYNSDYLEKNVKCSDFSDKDIEWELEIDLGEAQGNVTTLEEEKKKNVEAGIIIKRKLELELQAIVDHIKSWDPQGKNHLSLLSYDDIKSSTYQEYLSQEDDYDDEKGNRQEGWRHSRKNFDEIKDLDPAKDKLTLKEKVIDDDVDHEWINEHLSKSIIFPNPLEWDLKDHIYKLSNEWIEHGLKFHESDNDHCPFCRTQLSSDANIVIEKYEEHINAPKTKFWKKIDLELSKIDIILNTLTGMDNDLKTKFEALIENFKLKIEWKNIDTEDSIKKLTKLKKNLSLKKEDPETTYEYETAWRDVTNLNDRIQRNLQSIDVINSKIESVWFRQWKLRSLIWKKYFVEFYKDNKETISWRDKLRSDIDILNVKISEEKSKLPKIDTAEKIVDLFNIFIRQVGIDKYKAELDSNKIILKLDATYNISWDTWIISEGEKNAIGLCYFLASSIRMQNSIDKYIDTTFVIDDPVCSMSYKYFYWVSNLLKNFVSTVKSHVFSDEENQNNPQIILLTHNIQLYNMLTQNVFKNKALYFELNEKTLVEVSCREKLSEFQMALCRIIQYTENIIDINIGNDVRKVLETLCSFHGYSEFNQENLEKVFIGQELDPSLLMFAQHTSHLSVSAHEDPMCSKEVAKEMWQSLLGLMERQYAELINNVRAIYWD